MNRSLQFKILITLAVLLGSVYSLWPTFRLAQGSENLSPEQKAKYEDKAIRRGLDLKGGMYLVLGVDTSQLGDLPPSEALDRTMEIIRNRVDQFGVSEPVVQKQGESRIVVQLPGLQDAERAKRLIGQTARLEFRLVREGGEVSSLLNRLDRALSGAEEAEAESTAAEAAADSTAGKTSGILEAPEGTEAAAATDSAGTDSTAQDIDELLAGPSETPGGIPEEHPLLGLVGPFLSNYGGVPVADENRPKVEALLARPEVKRLMPRDVEFLWGVEKLPAQGGGTASLLYLVEKEVRLAGDGVQNAVVTPDPDRPPKLQVSLTLTRRGGLKFGNVTAANVGRKLAIVLDDKVQSAPVIQGAIRGGRASISGGFATDNEAKDLALVLRAGALPVDVHIEEERTVGPSLGADSIRKGVRSVLIGGALVIVFMILYYRLAGLLATAGLALTLIFLLGLLARLGLTLTLPGIAGIILTVGMAVDANVLIFERIREELRAGKSVRASVDAGYAQATRTIVDANLTTFITALVLFYFGTGPIKGFAVTLAVGILTSMFSALVFTRVVYQIWLQGRSPSSISI